MEDSRGLVWNIDDESRQELELLRFRLRNHPPRRLNFSDPEMPVFVLRTELASLRKMGPTWRRSEVSLFVALTGDILVDVLTMVWFMIG